MSRFCEKLTEQQYDQLSWRAQKGYLYCKTCDMFVLSEEFKEHACDDTRKYVVTLEITAFYPVTNDMKTSEEYAEDLGKMICDEITVAGGIGGYKIKS